jgi:hypothetical protein
MVNISSNNYDYNGLVSSKKLVCVVKIYPHTQILDLIKQGTLRVPFKRPSLYSCTQNVLFTRTSFIAERAVCV